MHLFLNRNDNTNLFGFGRCLSRAEKPKKTHQISIESRPKCSKKPSGPQLGGEAMSTLLDFFIRKGTPANTYGRECVLAYMDNFKKMLLLNNKSMRATRYLFQSMRCEVYAPVEAHPYPRRRQEGRLLFYRPTSNPTNIVRISIDYKFLSFLHRLNFIRTTIQRFHVESHTTKRRIEEFVELFGECAEELVWKHTDIQRALKFIAASALKLRYLECDINLLESEEFPKLKLNQFKSIKVKAKSDQIVSSLFQQNVKQVDLSELIAFDGASHSLFRPTLIPQTSLESARLRLNVCQTNELILKAQAIKQFAPNLNQIEFARNITGIEFDDDIAQFLFLEIEQIHDAVRSAHVKDIELSVRCVYSLQPEDCFSFRANAALVIICSMEKVELSWRPPPKSSGGNYMSRRREKINFKDTTSKTFRSFVHSFVAKMVLDYRRAECY